MVVMTAAKFIMILFVTMGDINNFDMPVYTNRLEFQTYLECKRFGRITKREMKPYDVRFMCFRNPWSIK